MQKADPKVVKHASEALQDMIKTMESALPYFKSYGDGLSKVQSIIMSTTLDLCQTILVYTKDTPTDQAFCELWDKYNFWRGQYSILDSYTKDDPSATSLDADFVKNLAGAEQFFKDTLEFIRKTM